jgi:hypothetical protein
MLQRPNVRNGSITAGLFMTRRGEKRSSARTWQTFGIPARLCARFAGPAPVQQLIYEVFSNILGSTKSGAPYTDLQADAAQILSYAAFSLGHSTSVPLDEPK